MKNILVTGSKGFLGSHIVKNFQKKYTIFNPNKNELDLRNLNLTTDFFNKHSIDTVIHCALSGREELNSTDPTYFVDGILMFRNIWLNKHKFGKLINLGTMYEFNQFENIDNVEESDFTNFLPITSYGLSKNLIARIILETENFYNLRLFGVFHESENNKRFFKKIIFENSVTIYNDQYIDYIYVQDIMPMIECIINNNAKHKNINMVYEEKYKLSELAFMLCDILNIDKNKIKILNSNGCNSTGNSKSLSTYNFKFIGIRKGMENYKICL